VRGAVAQSAGEVIGEQGVYDSASIGIEHMDMPLTLNRLARDP
jgi:hypothetical protein